jgi:hypothetical protein
MELLNDARKHLAAFALLSGADRDLGGLADGHLASAFACAEQAKVDLAGVGRHGRRAGRELAAALDRADPKKNLVKRHENKLHLAYVLLLVAVYAGVSIDRGSFAPWMWKRIVFPGFYVGDVRQDWGKLKRDQGQNNRALVIDGKAQKGLGTHAYSRIELILTTPARNFTGRCGYPDEAVGATIKCSVTVDGRVAWTSPDLSAARRLSEPFTLPLRDGSAVVLTVNAVGSTNNAAHAAWVDLKAW